MREKIVDDSFRTWSSKRLKLDCFYFRLQVRYSSVRSSTIHKWWQREKRDTRSTHRECTSLYAPLVFVPFSLSLKKSSSSYTKKYIKREWMNGYHESRTKSRIAARVREKERWALGSSTAKVRIWEIKTKRITGDRYTGAECMHNVTKKRKKPQGIATGLVSQKSTHVYEKDSSGKKRKTDGDYCT